MLIALLAATIFGGPDAPFFPKETHAAVREAVVDPVRQKAVLQTMKDTERARKKPDKERKRARKDLARLEADMSATAAEIRAAYDVFLDFRHDLGGLYTDAIFEMRENMTEEEWQAVFGEE